jgi:hypothetical protein
MRCVRNIQTAILAFSFFVSGCVFYPKKIEYYDSDCEIQARRLVLETKTMKESCPGSSSGNSDDVACLALILAVSTGSAIVSGSIVVVGNTVYWLEKKGKCIAKQKTTS